MVGDRLIRIYHEGTFVPILLNWNEGASLIRESNDLLASRLAWSGYFSLTTEFSNPEWIPCFDFDMRFAASVLLSFASDLADQSATAFVADRLMDLVAACEHLFLPIATDLQSLFCRIGDDGIRRVVQRFLSHVIFRLNSGFHPVCPVDVSFLLHSIECAFSPIEYLLGILQNDDVDDEW